MFNFVTLFDRNYLSKGLALYDSLLKHCDNFVLYILAMDQETEDYFIKDKLEKISIISLKQIESFYPELVELKKIRSRAEYCWTLTPYSIQYVIKNRNIDSCTYLDADIFFFNDPKIIFDEARNNSIIITEHKYAPECDQTKTSGKYCVQFVFFKNDNNGMEALEWWRQCCKEWCYARLEDGKFGDQKYLDDWTTRFKGVYVPTHIGCGLAPWNIQQYDLSIEDGKLLSQDKITKRKEPVIFFHFHGLKKIYADVNKIDWFLSDYNNIDKKVKKLIYSGYLEYISKYEKTTIKSKKKKRKSAFLYILFLIIKDIARSLLIFRKFKYYKKQIINENENICIIYK